MHTTWKCGVGCIYTSANVVQADSMPGQLPGKQIDDYLSMLSGSGAPANGDANDLSEKRDSMQSISLI